MNYTIEKVTTLIGARRYGDKDAKYKLCTYRQPLSVFP